MEQLPTYKELLNAITLSLKKCLDWSEKANETKDTGDSEEALFGLLETQEDFLIHLVTKLYYDNQISKREFHAERLKYTQARLDRCQHAIRLFEDKLRTNPSFAKMIEETLPGLRSQKVYLLSRIDQHEAKLRDLPAEGESCPSVEERVNAVLLSYAQRE